VTGLQELFVKTLTTQQLKRCFVVQVHVMEWISQDFGHPHQARLHILDEAQVNGTKNQTTYPQSQPRVANSL
jgi:hypothetical protein